MYYYITVKKYVDEMDYDSLLLNGAPKDEFDIESREISDRITNTQTEFEIAQIIMEVFNRTFGDNNTLEVFMNCAGKIYRELHNS